MTALRDKLADLIRDNEIATSTVGAVTFKGRFRSYWLKRADLLLADAAKHGVTIADTPAEEPDDHGLIAG